MLVKKTIMSIRMILVLVISSGDATSVYGNKRRGLMPTFAFFFAFLAALRETWFDVRHRICSRTETFRPRPALAAHDAGAGSALLHPAGVDALRKLLGGITATAATVASAFPRGLRLLPLGGRPGG